MENEHKPELVKCWRVVIKLEYDELDNLDKSKICHNVPEQIVLERTYFDGKPLDIPHIAWHREKDTLYIVGMSYDTVHGFSVGFMDALFAEKFYSLENKKLGMFERN